MGVLPYTPIAHSLTSTSFLFETFSARFCCTACRVSFVDQLVFLFDMTVRQLIKSKLHDYVWNTPDELDIIFHPADCYEKVTIESVIIALL